MVAKMIKHAAARPDERFEFMMNGNNGGGSFVDVLKTDPITQAFGVSAIEKLPMAVAAKLLPQARLRYAGNKSVDPGLAGAWNIDRPQMQFVKLPPAMAANGYMYGVLLVGNSAPRGDWQGLIEDFMVTIERDAGAAGVRLVRGGDPLTCNDNLANLKEKLTRMQKGGVRIVMVRLINYY
jgi:hypothetical protein